MLLTQFSTRQTRKLGWTLLRSPEAVQVLSPRQEIMCLIRQLNIRMTQHDGDPQGSVLGLFSITFHAFSRSNYTKNNEHLFMQMTQIYLALSPSNYRTDYMSLNLLEELNCRFCKRKKKGSILSLITNRVIIYSDLNFMTTSSQ